MNRTLILIATLAFIFSQASAKDGVTVRFVPSFHGVPVELENVFYKLSATDSVSFSVFKCYVSNVTFYKDDKQVYAENNSYHLVNAEVPPSMSWQLPVKDGYNYISFNLGVDSTTNVSGAMGGDLDPSKGMYWTWQSGYINFKLEGRSNLCATRKNEFQLHLGGYSGLHKAVQKVRLRVAPASEIVIVLPLDKFLESVDLRKQNSIMIPGAEAVSVAGTAARLMEIAPQK